MVEIGYNYRSTNRINSRGAAINSPRPDTENWRFPMHPNDTTRPTFITLSKFAKDITGQRFGRLVALGPIGKARDGHVLWLMQCDCGKTPTVRCARLSDGSTQSCGCYIKEITSRRAKTHGLSRGHLYNVWKGIVQRCTNPKTTEYPRYGGRGIIFLDEWRHSFEAFGAYISALPNYGEKGYTLDRIDNDGNYEPGNLRFATVTEQGRNKRNNRMITYEGKTQCVQAWEDELGFRTSTLRKRLKAGWAVERALTQPLKKR